MTNQIDLDVLIAQLPETHPARQQFEQMVVTIQSCATILKHMAQEKPNTLFRLGRWAISAEPLRTDAKLRLIAIYQNTFLRKIVG